MRVIKCKIFCALALFMAGEICSANEGISVRDEVHSMPVFRGVMEGRTVGQEGSSYIKMTESERTFFFNKLYPIYKNGVIGEGHWIEEKINNSKSMPELIQYKFYCGTNFFCFVVESDMFYWLVTIKGSGEFIDALPIYGWQSEWKGGGFSRKHIRAMALESDIFSESTQLLPGIEAYSPQTAAKFVFGISDARLLCSHFVETSYVPYEHVAFEQTRVYRLKQDGHFEVIQENSCLLNDEKIVKFGLMDFIKKAKSAH